MMKLIQYIYMRADSVDTRVMQFIKAYATISARYCQQYG